MVIIGRRNSKSTFGADNISSPQDTFLLEQLLFNFRQHQILQVGCILVFVAIGTVLAWQVNKSNCNAFKMHDLPELVA